MSQDIRNLEVDVALNVCEAFWQEINTPAHVRHYQASYKVKS